MPTKSVRAIIPVVTLCFLLLNIAPVAAAGPDKSLVGPQSPTGPQSTSTDPSTTAPTVGPQAPVGPQNAVGPQAPDQGGPNTQSNTGTGADSTNTNSSSDSSSTSVNSTSQAQASNTVSATASTGHNTEDANTVTGGIHTGKIEGSVNIVNVENSHFADGSTVGSQSLNAGTSSDISLAPATNRSSLNQSNGTTGSGSTNANQQNSNNVVQVVDGRSASADNTIRVQATTGDNTLTRNGQVDSLETGNIALAANVVNLQNVDAPNTQMRLDVWSVQTQNPDSVIHVPDSQSNATTGSDSGNSNSDSSNSASGISVSRIADSNTAIHVNGQTGNNGGEGNTELGKITTGSVAVNGSAITVQNPSQPMLYVVNVFGDDWNGSLEGVPSDQVVINRMSNTATGSGSDNSNASNQNNQSSYTSNLQASNQTSLDINALTGGNTLNYNTKVGDIKTGNIAVLANVINFMNGSSQDISGLLRFYNIGIINLFVSKPTVVAGVGGSSSQPLPQNLTTVTSQDSPVTGINISVPTQAAVGASAASRIGVAYSTPKVVIPTFLTTYSSVPVPAPTSRSTQVLSNISAQSGLTEPSSDLFALAADHSASAAAHTPFSPQWLLILLGGGVWIGVELIGYALQRRRGR